MLKINKMKFCIFCGQKPSQKTKEHVVPLWLIEMTGDPLRSSIFGRYRESIRKFAWNNFTFPACEKCNSEFSELEGRVKKVVAKLLSKVDVSEIELNDLLDWLDKVRVGLWLGFLQLNRENQFKPNFYIKQRLGVSDRIAVICYIDDSTRGITFTGTEFPAFTISPSCFSITINNIAIFNLSKEFVVSRRLGFTYPSKTLFIADDLRIQVAGFVSGTERVMKPIIRRPIISSSIRIYQAILNIVEGDYPKQASSKYQVDLFMGGKSKIYVENDFTKFNGFIDKNLEIGETKDLKRDNLKNALAIQTLDFQSYCLKELSPSNELLSKEDQKNNLKFYRDCIGINDTYITKLKQERMSLK